ncbi:MAG: 4Fe-4S dicluster domain-containing protein, partial [Acidobacteria bacterium]|nr:4Fe-4S dicluster domain-containing protein [Acidobacteriota bacterium]
EMSGEAIDTRTDIYSMGSILYELLVGTPPMDPELFRGASLIEIQRRIRAVEPQRPSTRSSGLGERANKLAEARRLDPRALRHQLQGDLDCIVLKAMAKEPSRRYLTVAELALDAATCIGCGACVAACPNGAAMLYTAAKVSHLGLLPQGQPERYARVVSMVDQMEAEGFGSCRNYAECEAACPKQISIGFISRMNRDYFRATLVEPLDPRGSMGAQ